MKFYIKLYTTSIFLLHLIIYGFLICRVEKTDRRSQKTKYFSDVAWELRDYNIILEKLCMKNALKDYFSQRRKSQIWIILFPESISLACGNYLPDNFSSIAAAAFFPAPIARITVAAPVTVSPPA